MAGTNILVKFRDDQLQRLSVQDPRNAPTLAQVGLVFSGARGKIVTKREISGTYQIVPYPSPLVTLFLDHPGSAASIPTISTRAKGAGFPVSWVCRRGNSVRKILALASAVLVPLAITITTSLPALAMGGTREMTRA